jgi:ABC-2 type transport system permease protein
MLARLLVHEIRLGLRLGTGAARWRWFAGLALLAAAPVALGYSVAQGLASAPDRPGAPLLSLLVLVHLLMLPLMASLAAVQVLRTFQDRADLDLLLAAPVAPTRVFLAKALASCWLVAMPFLVLLGPFILFSMAHGHWRWGGALLVILASATIATALGFWLVAHLIVRLGPRRARLAVHLGSAALGACIFIASQAGAFGSRLMANREQLFDSLAGLLPPPPLDLAARAMVGEPLPLLAFAGLAAASLGLAAGPAARRLAVRTQDREQPGPGRRQRYPASPHAALATKELLLIWRDPETLAQVLLRFIYLVPLVFLALQEGSSPGLAATRLTAGCVALAAMAASSLAWITVCAEEAPELVEAAPVTARARAVTKLAIACGLPLLALTPLSLWTLGLDAGATPLILLLAPPAALSMALIQSWHGPRMPRSAFRKRPRAMLLMGLVELLVAGLWALAAVLARSRPDMLAWLARPAGPVFSPARR